MIVILPGKLVCLTAGGLQVLFFSGAYLAFEIVLRGAVGHNVYHSCWQASHPLPVFGAPQYRTNGAIFPLRPPVHNVREHLQKS